ncbi:TPA: DUF86 domain-containing protein [Candidatus Woesearchaeota archaeon]|nr:DUF86 domain-containing protein [Candidatus Woesearchaeota archaeon]
MEPSTRITLKLQEMKKYLKDLDSFITSKDQYLADTKTRRACEKTIQLSIECVIDILAIIVLKEHIGPPTDEDSFIELVRKEGIITKELAEIVREMKGFRNIIVHKYGSLDDAKAYETIIKGRPDFETFEIQIRDYLLR